MSISKSQAHLLADGLLDNLGTGKKGLVPRETLSELFLLAGELVEDAQTNLNNDNSNASGKLSASIVLGAPKESQDVVSINIKMKEYGKYINFGVKGTRSGAGRYAFKTENPSPAMIKNLLKSKRRAIRSTRPNVDAKRSVSKNEIKNAATAESRVWGAAVNIKRYGIKATGFMDKAIDKAEDKVKNRLGATLKIDIINSI